MFKFKTLAQDMTQAQEKRSKRIAEIRREEAERKKQSKIKIKERSAEVKAYLKVSGEIKLRLLLPGRSW